MKPKEFDSIVRQKFDDNSFEFNPMNWEKLEARLDTKTKKNRTIVWKFPLLGIAAALTVTLGFAFYMFHAVPSKPTTGSLTDAPNHSNPIISHQTLAKNTTVPFYKKAETAPINKKHTGTTGGSIKESKTNNTSKSDEFISALFNKNFISNYLDQTNNSTLHGNHDEEVLVKPTLDFGAIDIPANKKKSTLSPEQYVKAEEKSVAERKAPLKSIILSGGVNYGNKNNGFVFGATGRRMISSKAYVEGDIAFAGCNNTQRTASLVNNSENNAIKYAATTKNSGNSGDGIVPTVIPDAIKVADQMYSQNYAEFTPSIGYLLLKNLSVGVGTDFQQALSDNRPAPATLDKSNIQVVPLFDIGFIGNTEFTINGNLKAAVYYREGINNIITPMNKYVERSYLQFQLKYAIFNR